MRLKAYNKDRETESILRVTNQRNDKGERREACVRGKEKSMLELGTSEKSVRQVGFNEVLTKPFNAFTKSLRYHLFYYYYSH